MPWRRLSDCTRKENFAPVDSREILRRVSALPITTWNYREDDPSIRHMGPMAQDFQAAFSLGEDDKIIDLMDEGGVVLAAIQALHELIISQQEEIDDLKTRLADEKVPASLGV
jgi:hypothetical protein